MSDEGFVRPSYTHTYPILEWTDRCTVSSAQASIISEYRIQVQVNGVVCMNVMCTPGEDVEMVLGRLFTEGFIDSAEEVGAIDLDPVDDCLTIARARIAAHAGELVETPVVEVPSTGAGSQVLRRYAGRLAESELLTPGTLKPWRVEDIFMIDKLFAKDSPLHKLTSGTHSCYMTRDGELVHCSEDIGRHNTVDKVIGWALRNNVDMSETTVFISGRVPTDMMRKAVRAKFNVFASRKSPTREAIDMARKYRVTLVGEVEKGRLRVFSGLQPVAALDGCDAASRETC